MWEIFGILAATLLSNLIGQERENQSRRENYKYNEMAAENQDARQRALFGDLYSPEAQLQQIKDAGLSTSLFYSGGTAGGSGASAPISGGAAGIAPTVYGVQAEQIANVRNINADTALKNAEKDKIQEETTAQQIKNFYDNMVNSYKQAELEIDFAVFKNNQTGEKQSLFEIATQSNNYDDFLKNIKDAAKANNNEQFINNIASEAGQKRIREIYLASEKYDTFISVLTSDKVNANFQVSLMDALSKLDYAKQSASAMLQQLQTSVSTNELTQQQKDAWNNLLKKLEKKAGTDTKDIIIVLAMLANNVASHWNAPTIQHQTRNNYFTTNNNNQ